LRDKPVPVEAAAYKPRGRVKPAAALAPLFLREQRRARRVIVMA